MANIFDRVGLVNRFLRLFLKTTAYTFLFVVVTVGALLVALPWLAQSPWAISQVTSLASRISGRAIVVEGPIAINLGRISKVSIHNVTVHESSTHESKVIFSLKDAEVDIPIYENLLSHYTLDNLLIKDVHLSLGGHTQSAPTKTQVSSSQKDSDPANEPEESASVVTVPMLKNARIQALSISDVSVSPARVISVSEVSVTSPTEDGGIAVAGAFSINDDSYTLAGGGGDVNALLRGEMTPVKLSLQSQRHSLEIEGSATISGTLDLRISAKGDDLSTFGKPFLQGLPNWRPYRLHTKVHFVRGEGPMRFSEIAAELSSVAVNGDVEGSLTAKGSVRGKANLTLPQFGIVAQGEMLSAKEYTFNVKGGLKDLSSLNPLVLTDLPQIKDLSVDGNARYTVQPQGGSIILESTQVKVAESAAQLSGAISFSPLTIQGKIAASMLDLTSLTHSLGIRDDDHVAHEGHVHAKDISQRPPKDTSPFAFPAGMTIQLHTEVETLTGVVAEPISSLKADITLRDGALKAEKISGHFASGSFEGAVEASPTLFVVRGDAKQLHSAPLFKAFSSTPFVEGEFDATFDLNSSGESVSALANTLSGKVLITSDHATFKSRALELSASSLQRILAPIFSRGEHAESDCVVLDYEIAKGRITPKGNVVNLGDVFIFSSGEADIPSDRVSLSFNVNSSNPSLASLIPPFRAVGSLRSPLFVPSASGSVASVFDTAEGIFDSAVGVVSNTARFILSRPGEVLAGKAQCYRALEIESKRLSSRVGRVFSGSEK